MKIEQYDKVCLRSGFTGYVVEIFGDGEAFLADIDYEDGTETEFIRPEDIAGVLKK